MSSPDRVLLALKAHHLLCLHGFRGLGYSEAFVAAMQQIKHALTDESTPVVMGLGPDAACTACPHLATRPACSSDLGSDRDRAVMAVLEAEPGTVMSWREWQTRIAERVSPAVLNRICRDCSWLPLGYCAAGIMELRQTHRPQERR